MYDIRKKTREKRDEIESITQETLSISGITLIKSFAREAYERARFYDVGTRLMQPRDRSRDGRPLVPRVGHRDGHHRPGVGLVRRRLVRDRRRIAGRRHRRVRLVHSRRLYGPAAALAGIQVQIVSALAVFERIFDYLDMTPEEYDPPDAVALPDVRGDIAFENVTFAYEHRRAAVLDGISFTSGRTGGRLCRPFRRGKTTITQLVPRFYDPQAAAF